MDMLIDTQTDGHTHRYTDRWTYSQIHRQMDILIGRQTDEHTHRYTDRWTYS